MAVREARAPEAAAHYAGSSEEPFLLAEVPCGVVRQAHIEDIVVIVGEHHLAGRELFDRGGCALVCGVYPVGRHIAVGIGRAPVAVGPAVSEAHPVVARARRALGQVGFPSSHKDSAAAFQADDAGHLVGIDLLPVLGVAQLTERMEMLVQRILGQPGAAVVVGIDIGNTRTHYSRIPNPLINKWA